MGESAKKNNQPITGAQPKRRLLKKAFILLILLGLGALGFAIGVYYEIFNPSFIAGWKNSVNQATGKPQTNFEPVDLGPTEASIGTAAAPAEIPAPLPPENQLLPPANQANALDKEQLAKQMKQEENKRISKLARLYSNMKPEEAVPILNQLDDDTVVAILSRMEEDQAAKIITQFDARRAALLTTKMGSK